MAMSLTMNHPRQNNNDGYNYDGNPFGYVFGSAGDEPAPAPEAPARGQPLLNDFELDTSHQFFDRFQNDQFGDDTKLLESLGGFQQEPAPNFHGVASSLGPPSRPPLNFMEQDLNARFDQAHLASPTDPMPTNNVLQFTSDFSAFAVERPVHHRHYSDALSSHSQYIHPQHPSLSRSAFSRQSAPSLPPPESLNFGDQSFTVPTRQQAPAAGPNYQKRSATVESPTENVRIIPTLGFGSDQNFNSQNYVPPRAHLEELRVAESTIPANMRSVEDNNPSAETTAPSSPTLAKPKRRLSDQGTQGDTAGTTDGRERGSISIPDAGDKRQRKVKLDDGDDDEDSSQPSKKGRVGSRHRTSSSSQMSRRKSQGGERPPRQNLTEEEKKQNHIRSEQKRRNQIKDGFSNLIELMPGPVAAGSSKCAILMQAVDWLTDLIEGNNQLQAQLEQLG